jgi:ribosomal protein L30E
MNSILNLLTICRKAGKLSMGFDSAAEAVVKRKARLIVLASDLSPKTEKEIRFTAGKASVPVIKTEMSIDEINFGLGKKVGVLAVCDEGFSERLSQLVCGR